MVSTPNFTGVFDASLAPTVEICLWSGNVCATPLIANFSVTTGPGSETVRLSVTDQHYIVNWHTDQFFLDPARIYRLRVRVAGTELGHADVQLVANAKTAKNISTGEMISLVDGKTLPIKFRIEQGAVAALGAHGGTAVFADGSVVLKVSAGALPGDTGITVTPIAPSSGLATDASVLGGTQYQFLPSPITFAQPVSLSLQYPSTLPPGVKASRLAVCKLTDRACVPLAGSRVNLANRTVTASVGSFSEYGLVPFPEMCYMESSGNGWWLHTDSAEIPFAECGDWVAGGSQMAYNHTLDGQQFSVHVINADGTGDRALPDSLALTFNRTVAGVRCPRWSPDGTKILVDAGARPEVISANGTSIQRFENTFLALMASDSPDAINGVIPIWATDWCAERWSPDGSQIAFRAEKRDEGGSRGIFVMNQDGTSVRLLVGTSGIGAFGWSADGTRFAFYADWAGNLVGSGLYSMNADGSNLHLVAPMPDHQGWQWSPVPGDNRLVLTGCDGNRDPYDNYTIACPDASSGAALGAGIWIVNADGGGAHLVLPRGDPQAEGPYNPRWSADARRIAVEWAYGPIPLDESAGTARSTYIVNVDGSGLQLLVGTSRGAVNAVWRP
jgi:hypothetical protein